MSRNIPIFNNKKCIECGKEVLEKNHFYCKPCNTTHWRDNFKKWTSGDLNIDVLTPEVIDWIEYSVWKDGMYQHSHDTSYAR